MAAHDGCGRACYQPQLTLFMFLHLQFWFISPCVRGWTQLTPSPCGWECHWVHIACTHPNLWRDQTCSRCGNTSDSVLRDFFFFFCTLHMPCIEPVNDFQKSEQKQQPKKIIFLHDMKSVALWWKDADFHVRFWGSEFTQLASIKRILPREISLAQRSSCMLAYSISLKYLGTKIWCCSFEISQVQFERFIQKED